MLLMAGRLPESWIQSVLYHHGCPQRGDLINRDGLAWLAGQPLPAVAREQVTVALAMIEALDVRLVPLDKELRAFAARQPGCKALMRHYGIGPLTSVTILAELGDASRFSSSREAVRYAGIDITVKESDRRRARPPIATGAAGVALGAVRGRPMRPTPQLIGEPSLSSSVVRGRLEAARLVGLKTTAGRAPASLAA